MLGLFERIFFLEQSSMSYHILLKGPKAYNLTIEVQDPLHSKSEGSDLKNSCLTEYKSYKNNIWASLYNNAHPKIKDGRSSNKPINISVKVWAKQMHTVSKKQKECTNTVGRENTQP
jgi:hypothetical protein